MLDYLMDIAYFYPYTAYDIIRDVIGFIWAKNKDNVKNTNIINSLYFNIRDFNICSYLKTSTEDGKRKLTLEEFRKYTVELFKDSIYDLQSIKNAIEERKEFYYDNSIDISMQDLKTIELDNLYNFISNFFDWIYERKIKMDNIDKLEIIKKLNELIKKYEKDV